MRLTFVNLFPSHDYGDIGNLMILKNRAIRRGIEVDVVDILPNDTIPGECDLVFIGGANRRQFLWTCRQPFIGILDGYVEKNGVVLAIDSGFHLLCNTITTLDGQKIRGSGVLDATVVESGERLSGNARIRRDGECIFGFENHAFRVFSELPPLGLVENGRGNNGTDGKEGCVYKNVFGTHLHGPLLSKNSHFADFLLRLALCKRYGEVALKPLDDEFENRVRSV